MVITLGSLLRALSIDASAGYADASDGLPTYEERETFLWTNAVRIDPESFENDYPCSFSSFTSTEQTSQKPLLFEAGLAAAASYHSHDMEDEDYFEHDSIDGTPWDQRIFQYYSGFTIGENIAYGYGSPYGTVVEGWMCSSGHRANIMSPDFEEMGTGVAGTYYTQDFGASGAPERGMAMGLHQPETPGGEVTLVVDWDGPSAPDEIYVILGSPEDSEGVRANLSVTHGTDSRGLYSVITDAGPGCQAYYFVATLGNSQETWPEDGSYGFGACNWDDAGAKWLDLQLSDPSGATGDDDDDTTGDDDDDDDDDDDGRGRGVGKSTLPVGCGCAMPAHEPPSLPAVSLICALALVARRARSR